MFRSDVKGGYWTIIKLILGFVAFGLFIYQIYFAGQWLISNKHEGRKISSPDYSSLKNGETVYGELENIVKDCGSGEDAYGLPLVYYLVRTSDEKLLVVRTEAGEKCDQAISNALGNSGKVPFVGYVKPMKEKEKTSLSLIMAADNILYKLGINSNFNDTVLNQVVDISYYKEYSDERVFIASVVSGLFMLGLSILFLRKSIKDVVYSIGVAKGKITPYMPEIDLVQHKDEFEKYEKINPDNAEDIEYYNDYEKDSVDFNIEEEHKTIYGKEYTKPTLEKDIPTYEGYRYDSLDFAQEKVEKKDINKF